MNTIATLPKEKYDAVIFDLDGVVTKTAKVHAAAWKALFDDYLRQQGGEEGTEYGPFDVDRDYRRYVDGKPRYDGVKSFLESRAIALPYGSPDDPPGKETICGLGNRKNELFHKQLQEHGVEVYESTVALIKTLKARTYKTAVVSSSKNCVAVLGAAQIADLFDTKVDGVDAQELHLDGKPAPDIFLEAARRMEVKPARAVVVEDAIAGVEAGRRGKFGFVIGVDRGGQGTELRSHGAEAVVADLAEISLEKGNPDSAPQDVPAALDNVEDLMHRIRGSHVAVFLDYDGTLTPIVDHPDDAVLSAAMRTTVAELARHCTVAIISGRDMPDVKSLVNIDSIFYAGSHGFDIVSPDGQHVENQQGKELLPVLDAAEEELRDALDPIDGVLLERKRFSIAVHYRKVAEGDVPAVETAVDDARARHDKLRKSHGKKVFELQPAIDWNKGKALLWLLKRLDLDGKEVLPVYIGDDRTDEDAFDVLRRRGIGILVAETPQPTAATFRLKDPDQVQEFLNTLRQALEREKP
jgi:alpha,alpha-trehalase